VKFQARRSITILLFCEEIKWIDALVLICDRTYFWQQTIWMIIIDIVAMTTFTGYGVDSQHMLGNLAQHCKSRSSVSQSDWHKVGSVDGRSTNCQSRNWRSKMHGKTKHSWSTINSEHLVNRRSVNRRSNLIWLAMEKPDLRVKKLMGQTVRKL